MNWRLVIKDKKNQPQGEDYTKWKEQIATECYNHCVYCSIFEQQWGGIDHYHIDHYRPKSKHSHLLLDICNLFYSCPVCNRFKSDDWPNEPLEDLSTPSYPDPSKVDYSTIMSLDNNSFLLIGRNVAANYIIERLYLNRPQLIYERREATLMEKEKQLRLEIQELIKNCDDDLLKDKLLEKINNIINLLHKRTHIRPYKLAEIRKP